MSDLFALLTLRNPKLERLRINEIHDYLRGFFTLLHIQSSHPEYVVFRTRSCPSSQCTVYVYLNLLHYLVILKCSDLGFSPRPENCLYSVTSYSHDPI